MNPPETAHASTASGDPDCVLVGDLTVDLRRRRVLRGAEPIALPDLSFDFLAALIRGAPEVVSIDSLMQAVWPGLVVGLDTVTQRVRLLRTALQDDSKEPRYIRGVRGRGYRLAVEPMPVAAVEAPAAAAVPALTAASPMAPIPAAPMTLAGPAAPAAPTTLAVPAAPATQERRTAARASVLVAALVLAVTIAIAIGWFASRPAGPSPGTRLAVLPFDNLSPDPGDAFFTDGLHEEILSTLSDRLPDVQVISRTTMASYRHKAPVPAKQVASELGATHLLAGSVRRQGDHVRLTLQLIDARADTDLWSKSYDRTLDDALTLQAEVAAQIGAQLSERLVGAGTAQQMRLTSDSQAYDLYLRGVLARNELPGAGVLATTDDFARIEDLFSAAIQRDPGFALAYAERAKLRATRLAFGFEPPEDSVTGGRHDIETARRLAPNDPKVVAAQSFFEGMVDGDWTRALRTFEAAETHGKPGAEELLIKSAAFTQLNRGTEAIQTLETAADLDPSNPNIRYLQATAYDAMHMPEAAMRTLEILKARSPADPGVVDFESGLAFLYTGNEAIASRRAAEVLAVARTLPVSDPLHEGFTMYAVQLYYMTRQCDVALAALDDLPGDSVRLIGRWTTDARGRVPLAAYRAGVALCAGQPERAAREGRALQDFLAHRSETPRNRWYLRVLASGAALLQNQPDLAKRYAQEAVRLAPRETLATQWLEATRNLAYVYARTGEPEQAVDLILELAEATPGLAPVLIARDPALTQPLAGNERYRQLVARVEDEMAHSKLRYPLNER